MRSRACERMLMVGCLVLGAPRASHAQAAEVPEHNRAEQTQTPPRPTADSAQVWAEQLFVAIVHDDPESVAQWFFPRSAFLLVKDISDPGRYWDQLWKRFRTDVHTMHARLPALAGARFERFELSKRGGFMKVHEEGNRLPYWAARHNLLYYRSAGTLHSFEVRVLITWDDRWYVIHLDEFH